MKHGWWSAAVVALAVVWSGAAQAQDAAQLPVGESYAWGAKNAPITMIVFSDFQCPFCARATSTIEGVLAEHPEQVRVVFKHNPLPFHKDAPLASEAALAAGEQGKFREMHDLLFQNQKALGRQSLEIYAAQLGLDMTRFREALDSHRYAEEIKQDMALAAQVGARGTPTFFINGRRVVGAQPIEKFREEIRAELDALKTAPDRSYAARVQANFTPPEAPKAPPQANEGPFIVPVGKSPVRGSKGALVTIVMFSDFQCPFCARVLPTLKQLEDEHRGELRLVFKHNPLSFHKDARLASVASMAAQEQGRFWEYHDALFQNQKALSYADLLEYSGVAGIKNAKRFKDALDHPERYDARIQADQELATQVDARGTPTFFINGRRLVGAQPLAAFQEAIQKAKEEAAPLVKRGLKGERLYAELQKQAKKELEAKAADQEAPARREVSPGDAPSWGDAKAPVTLVVFSDFQCPFCARSTATVEALKKRYGARSLRVVFKHMPLDFHVRARPAAAAAIAAGQQGRFWEMHDLLFQSQRELSDEALEGYARQLGLDVERFRRDMSDEATLRQIDADVAEAKRLGVTGTPTSFINGILLSGAQPEDRFVALIDAELAAQKKGGKKGGKKR